MKPPIFELPSFDVNSMLKEDSIEKYQGKPFRFGKAFRVDVDFMKAAKKSFRNDTIFFHYSISAKHAHSINLIFDYFFLSTNASLLIYNSDKTMLYGPITSTNNPSNKIFWTDLIKGESIIIQLTLVGTSKNETKINIGKAIYGYQNTFSGFGQSSSCNVDIACADGNGWRNEANSVAMILLADGTRWCSGSLLNNACQNLTPNLLTAFHCLDTDYSSDLSATEQNAVNNWVFRFLYESPTCGGGDGISFLSINGSGFRSAYQPSDFALLLLNSRPTGNVAYAGWSRTNSASTSSVGIHHPNGDVKKISTENNQATSNQTVINWSNGTTSPINSHWDVVFDRGGVQGGSSGSPLFNQDHRVVGQLHGGVGNCPSDNGFQSHYGRFDLSWTGGGASTTRLSDWLTNDPNVTQVNTLIIPSISSTNAPICSTFQFTVNNQPSGTTITWSSSNPSGLSINASGLATRVNDFNGQVTVTATINSGCGSVTLPEVNVAVGSGLPPTFQSAIVTCETSGKITKAFYQGTITQVPGAIGYKWYVKNLSSPNQGYVLKYTATNSLGYDAQFFLGFSAKRVHVKVDVTTSCGNVQTSPLEGEIFSPACDNNANPLINPTYNAVFIYPNPATSVLNIELIDSSALKLNNQIIADPYELHLIDKYQRKVYSIKSSEKTLHIPTEGIPADIYYLHLYYKDGVIQKQIVIKN